MSADILVLGALGNVGTEVVKSLVARGAKVRAAGHFPEKIAERFGKEVEAVYFDFLKPESFAGAFAGIRAMFLMRPPQISNIKRDMFPALEAARRAGVGHVTFLSLIGIENNKIVPHYKVETFLLESGQAYAFLRCSFFMQNLNTTHRDEIRRDDEIFVPVKDAKTSFIDVRDIGAVAAITLTEAGHSNKAYDLTGPEALDYYQVADSFTKILGRKITYRNPSPGAFFLRQLRRRQPLMFALVATWLYSNTKSGMADVLTGEVKRILGREPITMEQYIRDYSDSWNNGE